MLDPLCFEVTRVELALHLAAGAATKSNALCHFVDTFARVLHPPEAEPPLKRPRLDPSIAADTPITLAEHDISLNLDAGASYFESSPPPPGPIGEAVCYLHKADVHDGSDISLLVLEGKPGDASSRVSVTFHASLKDDGILDLLRNTTVNALKPSSAKGGAHKALYHECLLSTSTQGARSFSLKIRVKLRLGYSWLDQQKSCAHILQRYLPNSVRENGTVWTPQDFYDHVHIPDAKEVVSEAAQSSLVDCELYSFQRRAVNWLLMREGVKFNNSGQVVPLTHREDYTAVSFTKHEDIYGKDFFASSLLGTAFAEPSSFGVLNGGILSEEMGLGKTIELISLICLHRRAPTGSDHVYDELTQNNVTPIPGTLIITPPVILEQWKSELAEHAPSLKVLHYTGIKQAKGSGQDIVEAFKRADVVLTTYTVLASEIHYTKQNTGRELRTAKRYEARKSPLVQLSWWRVCLDEAQMIESGVSNTAKVARIIPRCNAWAVTGTPLRKNINDLFGFMTFLRLQPFCQPQVWDRLIHSHKDELARLCGRIALRHVKSKLRDELRLPAQKRVVITVPFSAIEEQHYLDAFAQMCDEIGVDRGGAPLTEDWDPESSRTIDRMRSWLHRLRQMCLHPQVGGRNRKALGSREGPLRTVDEVLEVMIDQNENVIRSEERSMLMAKVNRGHVLAFGKQTQPALNIYLEVLSRSNEIVHECNELLEAERVKRPNASTVDEKLEKDTNSGDEEGNFFEDQTAKLSQLSNRLRDALEVQHIGAFFSGTSYFQLKDGLDSSEADSERFKDLEQKEVELYEEAKKIRRQMLSEILEKTSKLIAQVNAVQKKSSAVLPLIDMYYEGFTGIESRRIMEKFDTVSGLLNQQSTTVREWQSRLVESLSSRLLDQDENELELTGEEYEQSTKLQDEQYVYLEVLKYVAADRHTLITGQHNALVKYESAEAYKTATKGRTISETEVNNGPAPQLMTSMLDKRKTWVQKDDGDSTVSLRGIVSELRALVSNLSFQDTDRSRIEMSILEKEIKRIQHISEQQAKALTRFNDCYNTFRSLMNSRLEFYRQLQAISDTVAPYQEEASDEVDAEKLLLNTQREQKHADKLAELLTKRRFLDHLREEATGKQENRICVICQAPFEIGVLVVCGHVYCKDCFGMWFKEHKNCPICRRRLKTRDFHEITYAPRDMKIEEEQQSAVAEEQLSASTSSESSIYTTIKTGTLNEIKNIDLNKSYGSKIDTIIRHVLWIRSHDPGAKSIIFSQYRDFLEVLRYAMDNSKVGSISIADKNGITRFKADPSIECFLLHAKADSSGLNLVNATHVILCEPLVNVAIELQAIARVHRIGQRRETTVWMYLVNDTVEEAIYDVSVTRRQQHMQNLDRSLLSSRRSRTATPTRNTEDDLDAVNSLALQGAQIKKLLNAGAQGGEFVGKDDLWSCLFSKARKQDAVGLEAMEQTRREIDRGLAANAAETRRLQRQLWDSGVAGSRQILEVGSHGRAPTGSTSHEPIILSSDV